MTKLVWAKVSGVIMIAALLHACVTAKPVEMQGAVDDRPILFFTNEGIDASASDLSIYIDDLYMGDLRQYLDKKKGLVILSGTHILEIRKGDTPVLQRKIYVGSGGSKTIPVSID